jgi:hypothetical protein
MHSLAEWIGARAFAWPSRHLSLDEAILHLAPVLNG